MRSVREAQGISQKEISDKLGISQSAIAQYEKSTSSLSQDTIKRAAELLNLNPDFLLNGFGNPFKQTSDKDFIKLSLPMLQTGEVDYSFINYIADYNRKAVFIFLKPMGFSEMSTRRVRQWQTKGLTAYALVIRDSDGNVFIVKRRDALFFNEQELILSLQKKATDNQKSFIFSIQEIDEDIYKQIKLWKRIQVSDINDILTFHDKEDYHRFLGELIDRVARYYVYPSEEDPDMYNKMKDKLQQLDPAIVGTAYRLIMERCKDVLKKSL
jgi:transcriptional regulator with XRE-family HTH domain